MSNRFLVLCLIYHLIEAFDNVVPPEEINEHLRIFGNEAWRSITIGMDIVKAAKLELKNLAFVYRAVLKTSWRY